MFVEDLAILGLLNIQNKKFLNILKYETNDPAGVCLFYRLWILHVV